MSLHTQAQADLENIYDELYAVLTQADYHAASQVLTKYEDYGGEIDDILNSDLDDHIKNAFSRFLMDNGK